MKKYISCLMFSFLFIFAANASVLVDFYAGGTASVGRSLTMTPAIGSHPKSDVNKPADSFGAVVGLDLPLLRAEAEYNYLVSDKIDMHAGMLNGYVKMFPLPIVKPYIGAGFGRVFGGKIGDDQNSEDVRSSMAYQGMLGLQFDVTATPLFVDVEGRVFYAPEICRHETLGEEYNVAYLQYDARVKLRYVF